MTYFERDAALKAQKSDIYSLHSNIKVSRACASVRYNGIPHSGWNKIYGILSTDNQTVIDKIKFFCYTNNTKTNRFTRNKWFSRFTTDQDTNRFTANTAAGSYTNTNIISAKRLVNRKKIAGFLEITISTGLQTVLVQTSLLVELT